MTQKWVNSDFVSFLSILSVFWFSDGPQYFHFIGQIEVSKENEEI